MPHKVPRLRTDAAAEAFLAQGLSDLDFSQFRPTRFEFEKRRPRSSTCVCRHPCSTR